MNCPACGYAGDHDGPVHKYMTASPACWAIFCEILARDYSDAEYARHHRLLTDAYCAQHSIGPDRRARQSMCIHGAALLAQIDLDWPGDRVVAFLRAAAGAKPDFPELAPPPADGQITVRAIHAAQSAADHGAAVANYGRAVHSALARHRPYFLALLERHAA